MSDNTNPPFYIGQKVVCLRSGRQFYKKNEAYIVKHIDTCPHCGIVQIGCVEHELGKDGYRMCNCGKHVEIVVYAMHNANAFAPIQTERIRYVAVAEELKNIDVAELCN